MDLKGLVGSLPGTRAQPRSSPLKAPQLHETRFLVLTQFLGLLSRGHPFFPLALAEGLVFLGAMGL